MFENQLGLRENPFVSGHQAKYVYPSKEHQEALAHLRYGIENREPFVLITGEVGTGKTTAIYDALAEWGSLALVALITNSALTRSELIEEICLRFGVSLTTGATKPQALVQLERFLQAVRGRGELAILLLDEAQNLDDGLLEEIRLLSNQEVNGEKLLQIFLVGQPELEMKLGRQELRQLRQRIAIHYRLRPLSDLETERYIHHRVSVAGGNANEMFPTDTCRVIHKLTHGIPREINTVAGQALLNAFVDDSRSVRPAHVQAMATETEFHSVLGGAPPAAPGPFQRPAPSVEPMTSVSPPQPQTAARAPIPEAVAPPPPVASTAPPVRETADASETEDFDTFTPGPPLEAEAADTHRAAAPPPATPVPPPAPTRAPKPPQYSAPPPEPEPSYEDEEPEPEYETTSDAASEAELEELAAMAAERADLEPASPEPVAPAAEPPTRREAQPPPPQIKPSTQFPGGRREVEETPPPDFALPEGETTFALPTWLDDLAEKKKVAEAEASAPPAPTPPAPTTPAPTSPSTTTRPTASPAAPAKPIAQQPAARPTSIAASAPEERPAAPTRIVPHPARPKAVAMPPSPTPNFVGNLSPRLRDKLSDRDERARRRLGGWLGWAAMLIGVAALAWGAWRFGPWSRASAPAPPPEAAATTPTEPPPTTEDDGAVKTPPQEATQPVATTPAPTPAPVHAPKPTAARTLRTTKPAVPKPASSSTHMAATRPASHPPTSEPAPAPVSAQEFGIVVGTFLIQDRANEESAALASRSGLPSHVMAVTEDGASVFRVVLGRFDDRNKAEEAASDLVGRGVINEARVTSLGPR